MLPSKPIRVVRLCPALALLLAGLQPGVAQMPPPPPPGVVVNMPDTPDPAVRVPLFEVVSVRPSKSEETRVQYRVDGFRGVAVTPQFLLLEGFGGLTRDQLAGEPAWASTELFDMEAKVADADLPSLARMTLRQRSGMFEQILKERFALTSHEELRQLPVYRLVLAKGGAKLTAAAPNDAAGGPPRRDFMMFGPGKITAMGDTMPVFVTELSRLLGRVVVDETGLRDRYDFTLEWTPEGAASPTGTGPTSEPAPPIFTAIQEQLGLKLLAAKAPVKVLVIDHMQRPSPN